ncbi:MAG TPA: ribonuclease HI family protein [Thermomicrobiales bacterium]|nr:ribonuclease HI family protein [Thermomicrobiales bacterium]
MAEEWDYAIVFDGGSKGNPGLGYGSYELTSSAGQSKQKRLEFGDRITNNEAEYLTLIAALEDLAAMIERHEHKPADYAVRVRGDSQLVIQQLLGRWKVNHPNMKPLHARARALLARFGRVDLAWHARANSVRTLGH